MNTTHRYRPETTTIPLLLSLVVAASPTGAAAPEAREVLEEVVVVAPYGLRLPRERVPASVQTATAAQIEQSQTLDLTDFINRRFGSLNINHAQNNPLQPDVNFRGFSVSPLLGLPQGLSVYQNGVRINEPFGDTINWDLIPLSAVNEVQLLAGAQPVFGLNTLGGALSVDMKTGFDFQGAGAEVYAGSYERRSAALQYGGNTNGWGYYGNVDYFEEDGWRDYSKSDALRFYGALTRRTANTNLDLSLAYAETELRGNGASPAELLAIDREQVFTHPDLTENTQTQVILSGSRRMSSNVRLAGNAFYRRIDTDSFNGDGTIFEECEFDDEELLVEEDFTDVDGDGECSFSVDTDIVPVLDLNGEPIEAEMDDEELNAINNIGERDQESYGASLQLELTSTPFGRDNNLTIGAAYSEGRISFNSSVEVARLLENRATSRTGIFAQEYATNMRGNIDVASLYFVDTLNLTDRLTFTFGGRYDNTRIRLEDRTGESPELNGSHEFERFNPSAGLVFRFTPTTSAFVSLGQSARAPTPVELACASEDAPCSLPNAFLADPPLEQVVATNAEIGVRGASDAGLRWKLGAFHTTNEDDILFQTSGGPQANVGFFANVGDTLRRGIELELSQELSRLRWYVQYSFIEATFDTPFIVNSPNHPIFDEAPDAPQIVGEDKLLVAAGSTIPGIPEHQANVGIDFDLGERLSIGADVQLRSGVYLRGDEANLLERTDGYAIMNLRARYRIADGITLFARIDNVFDEDYETFGLLGEPDEVFETFEDPRFFGAGPPFGAWIGIKLQMGR
ncbi:MAG TPA: TonB-dependent receptor [Steroidobacteraceae bacterium]